MAIFVYRRTASESARDLATALAGRKVKSLPRLRAGDHLVCWGERVAPITGVRILNGGPLSNKFEDAVKLRQERVPTIHVVRDTPRVVDATTGILARLGVIVGSLQEYLGTPEGYDRAVGLFPDFVAAKQALAEARARRQEPAEWLPRLNHHIGGNDLLHPPARGEYYAKKERLIREYRVHSFCGRSIRTGTKVHREGYYTPHEWVRSWDGGWRIAYDGPEKRGLRDLAHRAVRALDLDFGAVDIGERGDGTLIVLEVNRAPGLEGGTITTYARAIQQWTTQEPRTRRP